ncbi:MAG: hypothetical protein HND48_17850 [Chloroflexi bacterium]|nr:hypothetical protein [Chloroflexota bacterium]
MSVTVTISTVSPTRVDLGIHGDVDLRRAFRCGGGRLRRFATPDQRKADHDEKRGCSDHRLRLSHLA